MPRPTKSHIRNIPELADSYRWNVYFSAEGGGGRLPFFPQDEEQLNVQCMSSALPQRTNQPIDVQIRGHHIQRPGVSDETHTLAFQFVETVDNAIGSFLKDARDAIYHPETGVRIAREEYAMQVRLELLDNLDEPRWEYRLKGCFVQDIEPGGQLGGDGGQGLQPNLTLYYDTFADGAIGSAPGSPLSPL